MVNSMLSNVKITLKSTIPTSYGTGDTFTIFETGIVAEGASVVFSSKTKLERFQVDIATTGVCTIVLRGLDNTEIKNEVAGLKEAWDIGANGYITVLASDIFDKDATSPQTLNSPFIFNGAIKMNSTLEVEGDTTIKGDLIVKGQSKPFPDVVDEAARDILYPSPTGGEMVIVGGNIQIYNANTAQWETLDVGTPTPDATETIKGKARIATEAEALAGTNDQTIMTPKKVKELTTTEIEANEASLTDNTFMLGEPCTKGDSLFKEVGPTFAQASTGQNIGDVAGNTRVSIPVIGSGVAGSGLKLALAKTGSPSTDLIVRLETDNAGSPSGDLVDPNATATITAASLTTSLVDTSIALNTATTDNEHGVTLNNNELTQTNYKGIKFTLTSQVGMVSVDKVAACTATKAYLYKEDGTLLQTVSFVSNTATFNSGDLRNGQSYYILVGSDGSAYTSVKQTGSASFPYSLSKIDIIGGSDGIGQNNLHPYTFNDIENIGFSSTGVKIFSKISANLYRVKVGTNVGAVFLKNEAGTILAQTGAVSSGGYAVFNYPLLANTSYRIEVFGGGASISVPYSNLGVPINITLPTLNITARSTYGADGGGGGTTRLIGIYDIEMNGISNDMNLHNITQIKTNDNILIPEGDKAHIVLAQTNDTVNESNYFRVCYLTNNTTTRPMSLFDGTTRTPNNNKFAYVSSCLFANSLLSKTSATYAYKLPNDVVRFAKSNGAIGEKVKCSFKGIADLFTGLTTGSDYFLQNTPGAIGVTAGTNKYGIGQAIDTNKINISGNVSLIPELYATRTSQEGTTYSSAWLCKSNGNILLRGQFSGNAYKGVSFETSHNGITWIPINHSMTIPNQEGGDNRALLPIIRNMYYRVGAYTGTSAGRSGTTTVSVEAYGFTN